MWTYLCCSTVFSVLADQKQMQKKKKKVYKEKEEGKRTVSMFLVHTLLKLITKQQQQ